MNLECNKCGAWAKSIDFDKNCKVYMVVIKCSRCENTHVGPMRDNRWTALGDAEKSAIDSGLFRKEYTDEDYYWEKAEFQDEWSHRQHVENYKKGIHSSVAFDEQYMKEAQEELEREKNEKQNPLYINPTIRG